MKNVIIVLLTVFTLLSCNSKKDKTTINNVNDTVKTNQPVPKTNSATETKTYHTNNNVHENEKKNQQTKINTNKPMITLQKTSCYGKCPVYIIEIYENGIIKLNGIKNLDKIGFYTKSITQQEVESLRKEFLNANFFDFMDEYTSKKTDLPTTYISFEHEGKFKKIKDYSDAPEELRKLERLIENIVNSEGWKKQTNN